VDVHYLGPRNDVPALLAISDILVLPSYYREGVPRILLEGGAMGLPLITTNMPGCKDVVREGWNGLLVPTKDAHALSEAIIRLLGSRDERVSMGARSRRHVLENFTLEAVADALAEIYLGLLPGPSAPSESSLNSVPMRS
jgi:glycosyltransferase involved in cell wall biosynthesis